MGHIYAAVRRQQYYELKVSYQMKLKYLEERETFAVYDQYAKEYMADKQVEEREEHNPEPRHRLSVRIVLEVFLRPCNVT